MDAAFVDMQAELLVSAQRRPEAVRAVQLFVSLCPNDPLGPRLLLKYQEGAEDQDPTQLTPVQLLHRALELDPNLSPARDTLNSLEPAGGKP